MWLDSIYMGEPFLIGTASCSAPAARSAATRSSSRRSCSRTHVRDATTGLLYHAWDDSAAGPRRPGPTRRPAARRSVWGRALGWYAMALVDMLPDLPADARGRDKLMSTS